MTVAMMIVTALGLCMDTFAVALASGMHAGEHKIRLAFTTALWFAVWQIAMPCIGWLAGRQIEQYIGAYDGFIAFALLAFVGAKMIYEGIRGEDEIQCVDVHRHSRIALLGFATSIDALAVGISCAFLHINAPVFFAIVGITTFSVAYIGVITGNAIGKFFRNKAHVIGGITLMGIGIKILVEH